MLTERMPKDFTQRRRKNKKEPEGGKMKKEAG